MQIGVICYCDRTGAVSEAGSAYDVEMLPVSYTHLTLPTNREV